MLASVLGGLESRYRDAIATVRAEPGLADLPILIHGYDRALPGGFPGDDATRSTPTETSGWERRCSAHGIEEPRLREASSAS